VVRDRHEATVDQMYLQLRSDLVGDRFSCSTEQALRLGALAVHVEYPGGQRPDEALVEHYFAPSVLRGPARANLHNSLMHEFVDVVELPQDQAKLQFIQVVFLNGSGIAVI